ncbi:MAG: hypothetical protein WC899_08625 [bacterium]|jgi:hypothetical protein
MTRLVRAALALAVVLTLVWSAGCGRKAMPEPRQKESSSSAIPFGVR